MLPEDVATNPTIVPKDDPSFFKIFVRSQDEAHTGKGTTSKEFLIIQQSMKDSSLSRPSIFTNHQLKKTGNEPKAINSNDPAWILGLFLMGLLLVVIVKTSFPRRLAQIFNAFGSPRQLNVLIKEGNLLTERITPPLIFVQLISYSLFFYQLIIMTREIPGLLSPDYLLFLVVLGVVSFVYFFRILLIRAIGWIFGTEDQSRNYLINTMVINEVWGLVLLPICVMIFYTDHQVSWVILLSSAGMFIAMMLYLMIRNFMIGLSVTKFSWVYLILYLCTVEILPLAILGKFATDNLLIGVF